MQEVQTLLPIGSIIRDRYVVEALLGKGGFGAVYLVHDSRVKGNRFALKEVVDPKKQDRVHFLFEGEVLRRLDHSSLPRVYRAFEDESQQRVYLLMDYIEGTNLDRLRLRQPDKRFSLPRALHLMAPIMEAVTYLHNQQPPIIHRDIKPANIIIPSTEGGPVLVDFGIAKEYDLDETTTAVRRLSPNYSAPEQYTQGTNPRTDIYGMAATLYALLTGTVPTDAFYRMTQLGNQGNDPLEPVHTLVPEIPLAVSDAIQRAMAIDSNERFPTMQAFWDAVQPQSFLSSSPQPIVPLPPTTPLLETLDSTAPSASKQTQTAPTVNVYRQGQERRSRRRGILLPLFAFIALAAILGGILLGTSMFSTRHPLRKSASQGTATTGGQATPTHMPQATKTHPTPTATTPVQSTPISRLPTPTAQPQPTSVPPTSLYPSLNSTYIGTIHDTSANINGNMALTNIYQNGANMSGTLTLSNGLQGQANFTGTVSSNKTLRFVVTPYTQYPPLLFEGQVNADGSLTGTYCSVQGNACDYAAGGYGTWKVYPPSSSSDVPSQLPFSS